jgi:predicted nucleic acid-binding protein
LILYLDTSALVKLYVNEPGTKDVRGAVHDAPTVATSRLAYPECASALTRLQRGSGLTAAGLRRALHDLRADLGRFFVVELTPTVAERAITLTLRHPLRGSDAVHLASALELAQATGAPPRFACYDTRLTGAAAAEGLST